MATHYIKTFKDMADVTLVAHGGRRKNLTRNPAETIWFENNKRMVTIKQHSKEEMDIHSDGILAIDWLDVPDVNTVRISEMSGVIDVLYVPNTTILKLRNAKIKNTLQINKIIGLDLKRIDIGNGVSCGFITAPKLRKMPIDTHDLTPILQKSNILVADDLLVQNDDDGESRYKLYAVKQPEVTIYHFAEQVKDLTKRQATRFTTELENGNHSDKKLFTLLEKFSNNDKNDEIIFDFLTRVEEFKY